MSVNVVRAQHESRLWALKGACRELDPDKFFVKGPDQHRAKEVCRDCPVALPCLADALDNRIEFGVWGGMTERERRRLRRENPHITSWRTHLESSAFAEHTNKEVT